MNQTIDPAIARLIRTDFAAFVAYAFQNKHAEPLGDQPYIALLCYVISGLISGKTKRLLVNLPPQHLKTFVCTLCLAGFLLGENPKLRLLIVAYGDAYAARLAGFVRDIMNTPWYRQTFATRIKTGHDRINDFQTTAGGGIYAAGAQGAITGYPADVIIYDDPHQLNECNNGKALNAVKDNFSNVLSRMQNKLKGRIIVVAHRVSTEDLSADLISEPDWKCLQLPLVAPTKRTYELGHASWVRPRGDVLRPDAYSEADIDRLKRRQVSPPYALFHQQGVDRQALRPITEEHFQSHERYERPIAPVVISIDPGQNGGINASRSAIQAWAAKGKCYYLIDHICDHYDFEQLRKAVRRFIKNNNPSIVLIEKTANGPALLTDLKKLKPRFEIKLIRPEGSKADRLAAHRSKILQNRISLPADAIWRASFIDEIVAFPGEYDDQVDAMTQYLDFMDTKPNIPKMPPGEHGIAVVLGSSTFRRW